MICYLSVDSDVSSAQVPVFQRGGSVVCRSVGSCSCTAELRQLPLSVTVALNSQVTCAGYWNPTPMGSYFHTDKTNFFSMSLNFALWISHKDLIYGLFVVPFFLILIPVCFSCSGYRCIEFFSWGPDASIETIPPEGAKRLWTTSSIQVLVQIFIKACFCC